MIASGFLRKRPLADLREMQTDWPILTFESTRVSVYVIYSLLT